MSHKKDYILFLAVILFAVSCQNKKTKQEHDNTNVTVTASPDTAATNYNEAVSISAYNDAYTSSITQKFIVKPKRVTILTGKKGLKVTVNPAELETEDGEPVNGNITVKMVELTSSEDLFKSNAATMSNGRLLASGGSYFIGMECNGKKLQVKNKRTIKMEFPQLKEEEMELFYGDKDKEGNINWAKAEEPLSFNSTPDKIAVRAVYNPPFPDNEQRKRYKSKFKLYKKLTDTVYYQDKLMSIERLIHTLKNNGVDKNIDTLLIPAYDFYYGLEYNRNYKYDTIKRYRIVSCKDIEDDIAYWEAEKKITAERDEANRRYNAEWWKQKDDGTLESKIQRYYAPSSVRKLGWINCDRFYESPQQIETPVELPALFTKADVQYFLIFRSFNGLISGRLMKNDKQQYILPNLPRGERVTIVAFAKQNGQVYNCSEDFTITKDKPVKPSFKEISTEEMKKMFGSNISM